jgi:hypothetical protein
MVIDRYTKAVFTLIGVSLFLIALNPWIAPTKAYAQMTHSGLMLLSSNLDGIQNAIGTIDCSR